MHNCTRFQKIRREGSWRQSGLFREREIETVFVCKDCGRERSRRFRKLVAIDEIARPGVRARRASVLAEARSSVRSLINPEAISIREILGTERAARLDERIIKALAALAQLLESGDALPAKAFSAQVLGNSKALSAIRQRLEGLVGPLQRLGIRDWGGLV